MLGTNTPNVPTWNYAVVHAHGIPQPINSNELAHDLEEMVALTTTERFYQFIPGAFIEGDFQFESVLPT